MIDYQRLFHTGIRVPDLDAAMDELGESLGITWAAAVSNPAQPVWTPEGGSTTLPLRFVYSAEGPQHIELLEGPAGTIWDGREHPGVHHQGVWVDDVGAETERLVSMGWEVAAAGLPPEDGYGSFSYVVPPNGTIIELVTAAALPRFEQWWAGGTL
ncbi:MAG: VOC family protein [Actinomycetota bacterium]